MTETQAALDRVREAISIAATVGQDEFVALEKWEPIYVSSVTLADLRHLLATVDALRENARRDGVTARQAHHHAGYGGLMSCDCARHAMTPEGSDDRTP